MERDGQREGDERDRQGAEHDQPAVERTPHDPNLLFPKNVLSLWPPRWGASLSRGV